MLFSYRAVLKALGSYGQGSSVQGIGRRHGRRYPGVLLEALEQRQLLTTTVTNVPEIEAVHATSLTFSPADFTAHFTSDAGTLTTVKIVTLPVNGTLTLGNQTLFANATIPLSNISMLVYTQTPGFTGGDPFEWNGSADETTFADTPAQVALAVLPNTPPTVTNVSVPVTEGIATTFTPSEFTASFSDTDSGDSLQQIEITSLPAHGTLTLSGTNVTANQTIAATNIANLTYTPTSAFTGADAFGWNGSDGFAFAATGANVSLTVANTPPTVSTIAQYVLSGQPLTFTTAEFSAGFTDSDAGDTLQAIQITALPTHGTLTLSGAAVTKNETITAANITNLTYTPKAGFIGQDSFGWNASDGKAFATKATTATLIVPLAFDVIGNNVPINNGDTNPSAGDFTDFGNFTTSPDASMETVTRTYTIKNSGTSAVTIGANAVTVGGANPSDFVVITQPTAGTLAVGDSATFVVQFIPGAAGKRTATLTVANSSGTPFVYTVQGNGIRTTSVAAPQSSTDITSLVQQGTTQSGSGAGAQNGQILSLVYTGYLTNGTVFDSTAIDGGKPLTFRLDDDYLASTPQPYLNLDQQKNSLLVDQTLIAGFEYGLQGIKAGEKRTLVINSSAGYGASGQGVIPGGATLIFDVQCVNLVTKPQLTVDSLDTSGNPTRVITAGQKTISADDNTLFTLTNAATLAQSYKLLTLGSVDATGALLSSFAFRGPRIKLTGAGAKDFGVSLSNNTLTLTYHPQHPGTKDALVKLYTTDPVNPIFIFAIEGTSTAFTNLTTTFNKVKFPTDIVTSGSGLSLKLPLLIGNSGTTPTRGGSKSNIQIYAVNNSTSTFTLLTSENNVNVGGIGINKTKKFNFNVVLPVTLATGSYSIFAQVNQATLKDGTGNGTLTTTTEVSTEDDGGAAAQTISIRQGIYQLGGAITASTVTATSTAVTGNLSLNIQNTGSINLPVNQMATIDVVAHPANASVSDTSHDIVLESGMAVKLGLLSPSGTRAAVVPITYPSAGGTALAAGSYILEATVSGTGLTNSGVTVVGTIAIDRNGNRSTLTVA